MSKFSAISLTFIIYTLTIIITTRWLSLSTDDTDGTVFCTLDACAYPNESKGKATCKNMSKFSAISLTFIIYTLIFQHEPRHDFTVSCSRPRREKSQA